MSAKKDLTGKRFGRWTVIKDSGKRCKSHVLWECLCDCGNISLVSSASLNSGLSKSCGCVRNEQTSKRNSTHGDSKTRLYRIWTGIISRCYRPSQSGYKNYGSRGIKVCDEWRSDYDTFKKWALSNGYKDDLTIERINCNSNYCPHNCKWIPKSEQCNNTRQSHFLTIDEETRNIKQWADRMGVSDKLIRCRLRRGWSEYNAVMVPKLKGREVYEKRGFYCSK